MYLSLVLLLLYLVVVYLVSTLIGGLGLLEIDFQHHYLFLFFVYIPVMTHLTITAMSLSYHRYHTHKGVILHPVVDFFMQAWLWLVTSMSKRDWVSVHRYHHAHSDQSRDPHSPVQKGFWHVFLFGVVDYTKAKNESAILNIRKKIPVQSWEIFFDRYQMLGPAILTGINLLLFGALWGTILSIINFSISPLFAVGGVNALAHTLGYKNHHSKDNSRNIGFLFPLNFLICGELDHNNHHAQQVSCSFRHRWYEFDIGFLYIKILERLKLAKIKYAFTPQTFRQEVFKQWQILLEKDNRFQKKCMDLCYELGISYQELQLQIKKYLEGEKVKLVKPLKELVKEMKRTMKANYLLRLSY